MANPSTLRSGFPAILLAVQAKVAAVTGLDPSRVKLVAMQRLEDCPDCVAPQDVLLWPRGFVNDQQQTTGAGRVDTRLCRKLAVVSRTRLARDKTGEAIQQLTDPELGLFALEESALNALHGFWPSDGKDNLLTTQVLQVTTGDDPLPNTEQLGWILSVLYFDVCYEPALTQTLNV